MKQRRIKHSFTSGEISPLMEARKEFERYNNGAKTLKNAVVHTQGPVSNRTGFEFIFNLNTLGLYALNEIPEIKLIPFVFNENQSYVLIFFRNASFGVTMVIADDNGLITYPDPVPAECPPGTPTSGLVPGDIVSLDLPSLWDIETMDYAQSGDELYITMESYPPQILTRYSQYCWAVEAFLGLVTDPPAWGAVGYPAAVTFHQQRIVFAGTPENRQTVWMSKAGDFLDFGKSNPSIDSDSVVFTLDSGTQNKIHWMHSARELNIGTIGNEWTVTGSTRSALTPSNILAQPQTSLGSIKLKPVRANSSILFVGRYGRTAEEFVYNFNSDSYVTSDISILSEHLTTDYSIVEWTYQQSPDRIIWCVREDGALLGITYQRDHEVIAWHQHHTDGEFLDAVSVPGTIREDELWVVVKRRKITELTPGVEIDESIICLEKKVPDFEDSDITLANFLDSSSTVTGTDISTITGLDHLNGVFVTIFADGFVLPSQTVVDNTLTLPGNFSRVTVGRPYETLIVPNLAQATTNEGPGYGATNRTTKVDIDLYRTLGAFLGRENPESSEVQEEEIGYRKPWDSVTEQTPLFTGIKHLEFPLGQSRNEQYFIKQTQPLPLTVRAVIDTVEYTE